MTVKLNHTQHKDFKIVKQISGKVYRTNVILYIINNHLFILYLPEAKLVTTISGNFLPEAGLPGKEGATYYFHGALCLETQNFPDFVHQPDFPAGILYPGQRYQHILQLRLTQIHT